MSTVTTKHPTLSENDPSNGGEVDWLGPNNVNVSGCEAWTSAPLFNDASPVPIQQTSVYLKCTQFGFSLPTGTTIHAIRLLLGPKWAEALDSEDPPNPIPVTVTDWKIYLVKAGVPVGDNKASAEVWTDVACLSSSFYGDLTSDLWGETWTTTDINHTSFGVVISAQRSSGVNANEAPSIDYVELQIAHSEFYDNTSSGGAVVGGSADLSGTAYAVELSGGVVCGGSILTGQIVQIEGGVVASGEASSQIIASVRGGTVISGSAEESFYDNKEVSGGVIISGSSVASTVSHFFYTATGSVYIGGVAGAGIKDRHFNSSGEVILGSSFTPGISFEVDISLLWNVRSAIRKDLTLLWNTGNLPIFWYRVIGKGRDGQTCNLIADPCCQKFIMNIHARTLSELCDKLKNRRLNLPIESVQRFSRPAENSVLSEQEDAGANHDCNVLEEEINICEIPACAEVCIDYDLRSEFIGFEISKIQVNGAWEHESEGSVFIGGSAGASPYLFTAFYEMSGSLIVEGSADAEAEFINGQGGIVVSGTVNPAHSNWSYIGGEWPSSVLNRYGLLADSVLIETGDEEWAFPEEALVSDDDFTQTDISYFRNSQFLVVRDFKLRVPEDKVILGLVVEVDKVAVVPEVFDLEVYLVVGDTVISNNLADVENEWPLVSTLKIYGTDGLDGIQPWREEPLLPEEVNDSEFGFAIRVTNVNPSSISIAKIDFIRLSVYYEDPIHQRLRTSGEAGTESTDYNYFSDGEEIVISGNAGIIPTYQFLPIDPHVILSGLANTAAPEHGKGGVVVGGEAHVVPIFEFGLGGVVVGGDAVVKPYVERAKGGVVASGSATLSKKIRETAAGGVAASSGGLLAGGPLTFGGAVVSGQAHLVTSQNYYFPEGDVVIIGGAADVECSDLGTFTQISEFQISISELSLVFAEDQHIGDASVLTSNVIQCGCPNIPLVINLEHNLDTRNRFTQFLARNGLSISRILRLSYNKPNTSWQTNLHYSGFASDSNTQERWDFVFELQCTNVTGAINIGRNVWKLAIDVFRRNLGTAEDFNTRLIVGILPEPICESLGQELIFDVNYDTQADFAIVTPNATIYQASLYDSIGLFRNKYWIDNPELVIKVSQAALDAPQDRIDLTESILIE